MQTAESSSCSLVFLQGACTSVDELGQFTSHCGDGAFVLQPGIYGQSNDANDIKPALTASPLPFLPFSKKSYAYHYLTELEIHSSSSAVFCFVA
jgi:hypothetical protein